MRASSLPEWVLLLSGIVRKLLSGRPVLGHAEMLLLVVISSLGRGVWLVSRCFIHNRSILTKLVPLELGTLHHGCLRLGREGKSIDLVDLVDHLLHLLGLHNLDRGRVCGLVFLPDGRLLGLKALLRQLSRELLEVWVVDWVALLVEREAVGVYLRLLLLVLLEKFDQASVGLQALFSLR